MLQIPLIPELEQSFSSLAADGEFGMEGLRRAMLSSDGVGDTNNLTALQETDMEYETG